MNNKEATCTYTEPSWFSILWHRVREWFAPKRKPSSIFHAEREFKALGYILLDQEQEDEPNTWIQESVMELLEVFSKQGHSGFSAPYVIDAFSKLAGFEPLSPLTGEDWEWAELDYGEDMTHQNKRCSHVFKGADGRAYDINGKVFREPSGSCYTNGSSRVYVEFPYTPKTEYVDVPA